MIERWQQVKQILHDASELPAESRKAFVMEASAGDPELIAEVESLLDSFEEAGNFLEEAPLPLTGERDDLAGRWIGEYHVERLIARGGMGSVHLAVKEMDGVPLKVALKVIRLAGNHHYLSRRFRMERQILARLQHENILRLLDGGVTPDGWPYIVTEFLDAWSLESWLSETQPTLSARLKVFQAICDGIAYAHRNLIVHGDIKPSNILITREGVPKLVDFGIARLLSEPGEEDGKAGQLTITMTPALTPWWASPEQLGGEPLSMESDCYELGRILFFLLAEQKPHDFSGLSPQQILDKLRREPPPKPSVVTGDNRLAGDLDNITLKALEFDKAQRYRSVDALSDDITRHLSLRPISARAQTLTYRLEKFVRRNRGLVSLTALATVTILAALAFAFYQAGEARAGYETSRLRFEQVRSLANSLLFEADDALVGLPGATPVRAKLVQSAVVYLDQLAQAQLDDPQLQEELAAAYEKVGDIQGRPGVLNLGQTAQSLESYRKSEAIREAVRKQATKALDFVAASDNLSSTYARISASLRAMGDVEGGLAYERKALGIRQALFESAPENPDFKRGLASSLATLSGSLSQMGDFEGVMDTRKEALKMYEEILAANPDSVPDKRALALALARMGSIELHEGQLKESLEHYRRALEIDTDNWRKDPSNVLHQIARGWSNNNFGLILNRLDRPQEALEYYAVGRHLLESVVRADERDVRGKTLLEMNRVRTSQALLKLGRGREALGFADLALRGREQLASQDPLNAGAQGEVAEAHVAVGKAQLAMGQRGRAREHFRIAHGIFEDLVQAERSNAAMIEELEELEKDLKAMGEPVEQVSAARTSRQ